MIATKGGVVKCDAESPKQMDPRASGHEKLPNGAQSSMVEKGAEIDLSPESVQLILAYGSQPNSVQYDMLPEWGEDYEIFGPRHKCIAAYGSS
ncbi:hypothetical protein EYZ11_008770 [Aspergillus tanneri]|uniref:Uncharacterized protein n=1 Tax=Aspergillus tanneri TaxID=1220188 RepID=A0A4S3J9L3_9EURO|nr:hypothetical protein EYZ11_008770 [Aspergillus tanneri]